MRSDSLPVEVGALPGAEPAQRAVRAGRRSGRLKIQFCQAVSRPKIFVSSVSGPAKR